MTTLLPCGHEVADANQIHYCSYLRLDELLHLQPAGDNLRHPDEHLFVTTHQAFELWFQQILFDMRRMIAALDGDNVALATVLAQRITRIVELFVPMTRVIESMPFSDFYAFRDFLTPASGSESQQFRAIELLAGPRREESPDAPPPAGGTRDTYAAYRAFLGADEPSALQGGTTRLWTAQLQQLWEDRSLNDALMALLARRHIEHAADLYAVAPAPYPHPDIFLLAEALLDFDETLSVWQFAHARMAERVIGAHTRGTGQTSGAAYLTAVAVHRGRLFPALWQAREYLDRTLASRAAAAASPDAAAQPAPTD